METSNISADRMRVAPLAGAGIEITMGIVKEIADLVAPLAGAGIEIGP